MPLAAFLALSLLADAPAAAPPALQTVAQATTQAAPDASASAQAEEPIPPGAPTDDYRFVAWCYGAMDESIGVYRQVLPQLKAIDARFGSPVKEAVPYAEDVADEKLALKRFASAMEAAERASPRPIANDGARAMELGRAIWTQAKLEPARQEAHAWLLWGSPDRCETAAARLKRRATLLGQAMAVDAPVVEGAPKPAAAPDSPVAPPPATPALTKNVDVPSPDAPKAP